MSMQPSRPVATALACCLLAGSALSGCAAIGEDTTTEPAPPSPEDIVRLADEGDDLFARGDHDKALARYVLALERDPRDARLHYRIGVINELDGRPIVAERNYRQTLRLAPEHVGARVRLGVMALRSERFDQAERMLSEAIEREPDNWRALNALGVLHDLREAFPRARARYEEALAVVPDATDVLNNYGYSYYLEQRWRDAERYFLRAVTLDPQFSQGWSNLALVYLQLGEEGKAKAAFEQVVDEHQALNNLGYFELLRDRPDTARRNFESAAKRAPSYYPRAHENLASLEARRNASPRRQAAATASAPAVAPSATEQPNGSNAGGLAGAPGVRIATADGGDGVSAPARTGASARESARRAVRRGTPSDDLATDREILRIQRRLAELGYDPGPIDGRVGARTRAAVRQFRIDNGLSPDGSIDLGLALLLR